MVKLQKLSWQQLLQYFNFILFILIASDEVVVASRDTALPQVSLLNAFLIFSICINNIKFYFLRKNRQEKGRMAE